MPLSNQKSFVIIAFVKEKLNLGLLTYLFRAPIAQLVEQQPFKLMVAGSSPAGRTALLFCRLSSAGRAAVL